MIIDWTNTEVTGISDIRIEMLNEAKILIFRGNDLTCEGLESQNKVCG